MQLPAVPAIIYEED